MAWYAEDSLKGSGSLKVRQIKLTKFAMFYLLLVLYIFTDLLPIASNRTNAIARGPNNGNGSKKPFQVSRPSAVVYFILIGTNFIYYIGLREQEHRVWMYPTV